MVIEWPSIPGANGDSFEPAASALPGLVRHKGCEQLSESFIIPLRANNQHTKVLSIQTQGVIGSLSWEILKMVKVLLSAN